MQQLLSPSPSSNLFSFPARILLPDCNNETILSTAVISSVNAMSSGRQALEPVPGNSSSSSGCVSRQADASMNKISMCHRLLRVPVNGDKRLASSYPSFLLGRMLSLTGSISLLIGLFFRFIFMGDDGVAKSIPFTIIGVSIAMVVVGAVLVIWSAHKSKGARKLYDQDLISNQKPRDCRPDSGLSSGSFN